MKIKNGSKELMKEINRFKVLNIIREKQPISRVEISNLSELSASTLTYIMDDLMDQNLIREVGESSSTGGRRAKLLEFNNNFGSVISVKIEEEQLLIALMNMNAEVIELDKIPFKKFSEPEVIIKIIENKVPELLSNNERDYSNLRGIGILSSGLVNRHEGIIVRSSMLGWKHVPIARKLHHRFPNIPIFIDKNINGYTLAELWKGEGKTSNDFLVVSVGAGLGLSVVKDKKIYYGAAGGAGEFGHTTLAVNGYQCHCGQKGCIEMYASEFYFQNKGKELVDEYPDTSLKRFCFDDVAKQALKGDELANRLIREMSQYLGLGVRNLINTFNPEKVVMAGEGMKYSQLFMEEVREISRENFFSKVNIPTEIVESKLNDSAWMVGGALLVINHIFQVPIYEDEEKFYKIGR